MKINLELIRSISHQALNKYISGNDATTEISIAKFYGANKVVESAMDAIKILGSYGIIQNPISEVLLSSFAATIAGGTEEVHREVIFQNLYRQYRNRNKK